MSLSFKRSDGSTYTVSNFSVNGADMAKASTESDTKKDKWYKLNEECMVDGIIGSVTDLNTQIDELVKLLKRQRSKLESLSSVVSKMANTSCSATCNVPGALSAFSNTEVAVISAQIDTIDATLIFLGFLKTYLGFNSQDNMYFKC